MAFIFQDRLQIYLNTARALFEREGRADLAAVLKQGRADLQVETGYDNWDGGQYSHTLTFVVPIDVFHAVAANLAQNEQSVMEMLNKVSNDARNESLEAVNILLGENINSITPILSRLSKGGKIFTAFDEYTLDQLIGQGGNGSVFSAKDKDGNECAIKFLRKGTSANKFKRFKNEIRFCELCQHPNIVPILDYGYADVSGEGYAFYVMPRYDISLKKRMEASVSPQDAVAIFEGLLSGLKEAHKHDVIHRDIKPDNIMFAKGSNVPVICDFGIAHIPAEYMATTVVTQPHDRMANWGYAAPEQRGKGGKAYAQSDIYSAGLILNEMFTGEIPNAIGYKTIGEVSPEYAYLDDVFESLFKQDPAERLYPEEKILEDMKIRAGLRRNNAEIERLKKVTLGQASPATHTLKVQSKDYIGGNLYFHFNQNVPREWLEILNAGAFSHTSVMGYDANCVIRENDSTLKMNVSGLDNPEDVKNTVGWFEDWVMIVNAKYADIINYRNQVEQHEREEARKREIAHLEKENKMRNFVAGL